LRPDSEVLEFGCGTGTTAISHAPFAGHILAIDFSEKMLVFARARAKEAGVGNVSFKRVAIEEFDPEGRQFDMVMAHSILHLLPDRELVISKVFDLLKPGGIFVSSTACMGEKSGIFKTLMTIGHSLGFLPLVKFFNSRELEKSIKSVGFEIIHQWQPEKDSAVFIIAKKPE